MHLTPGEHAANAYLKTVSMRGLNSNPRTSYLVSTNESVGNIQEQIVALLPRLRRFARGLVRNPHDADDVVQIAVERALLHLDQWHRDARLDSWLFKIVRNAWIDEVRSRGRGSKIFMPEEAGEHVGEASMERVIDRLSVDAALSRLPQDQRLAVSLVLVEGLSYKDAADVLEVPIGTLTSRLSRGREALQAMLQLPGGELSCL
jgi:RNA polymerase sigma-70 factor (ECF subfamily)